MPDPTRPQPSRLPRAAALLIALLSLWMATVGVVGHTDDLQCGASASPTAALTHKLAAGAPADACVACQWLAALQAPPVALAALTQPHAFRVWAGTLPTTRAARQALHQNGTRAPPVS